MKICQVRKHLSGKGNPSGRIGCSGDLIGKKVLIRILTDEEIKMLEANALRSKKTPLKKQFENSLDDVKYGRIKEKRNDKSN